MSFGGQNSNGKTVEQTAKNMKCASINKYLWCHLTNNQGHKSNSNRCFSILLSGCETGQRFRCYVVATHSAAEHSIELYASSTVTMSRVLARFSVWSSIFDFF